MMKSISLPLSETNLAEVLAGIAIHGILDHTLSATVEARWHKHSFQLQTMASEAEIVDSLHTFLVSMEWIPSFDRSNRHRGAFIASDLIGISPFSDPGNKGEPSIYKTFAGDVSPVTVWPKILKALKSLPRESLVEYIDSTTTSISSLALDCRTSAHTIDRGYSPYDSKVGEYDTTFVVTEALACAALSFFIAGSLLSESKKTLRYTLWSDWLSASTASLALTGSFPLENKQIFETYIRGKSYGKGASYKYILPASPIPIY